MVKNIIYISSKFQCSSSKISKIFVKFVPSSCSHSSSESSDIRICFCVMKRPISSSVACTTLSSRRESSVSSGSIEANGSRLSSPLLPFTIASINFSEESFADELTEKLGQAPSANFSSLHEVIVCTVNKHARTKFVLYEATTSLT